MHRVASLPRDQRCWHSISPFAQAAVYTVASLPRDQRCWHIETQTIELAKSSRIASERSTLLAHVLDGHAGRALQVASLPRDQRCWHPCARDALLRQCRVSHRFREINAVGTGLQGPACVRAESHRFREINAVGTRRSSTGCSCAAVASLPRDQRCWHVLKESKNLGKVCRIASERSTLLAPIWRRSNRRFPRGRIASERSTLLAHNIAVVGIIEVPSHRFREINAVGTSWSAPCLHTRPSRIASERSTLLALSGDARHVVLRAVASLPRDQRCWHMIENRTSMHESTVASLPKLQRCWHKHWMACKSATPTLIGCCPTTPTISTLIERRTPETTEFLRCNRR